MISGSSQTFRRDIQGLRAVAVLLVLVFHFETPLHGGYLGVDMFFVISGFVIASSTLREIDNTNTFSWRAFLHRRIRRLLPGMAVVAVTTSVMAMLFLSPFGPQKETAKMLLGAATYMSNFILMPQSYFSLDPKANPMLHMWSLAVEEQIYFVWPLAVLFFVGLRKRLQSSFVKVMAWFAVISLTLVSCWMFLKFSIHGPQVITYSWFKPLTSRNITPEHFAFYSPITRAWEFIVGVSVALFLRIKVVTELQKAGKQFACIGAALVTFGVAWASKLPEIQREASWSTNTSATLAVVVGTALWIFGGSHDNYLLKLTTSRPLKFIGDCSYSIYLLHWPIWVLLITSFDQSWKTIVIAFGLSLGFGWLQFRYVEEPIRSRRRLPSIKSPQLIGGFAVVSLIGFALMSFATPRIAVHIAGVRPNELSLHIVEKPCPGEKFETENAKSCQYSPSINDGVAILVGDSMAKSLSDGFVEAANAQNLAGYVFTYPGCPFLRPDSPFVSTSECSDWRVAVFGALQQLQPRVLIIANLNSLYIDPPLPDWSVEDTQQIWGSELKRTVEALSELRTQLVIAQPPPKFAFDLRYDLSLFMPNSAKEEREVVFARRQKMNEIEQIAISGFENIQSVLDFTDQFCNEKTCNPRFNNKLLFEDPDHLSVEGSKLVFPEIERAISGALFK